MSAVLYTTDWLTGSARTRANAACILKISYDDATRVDGAGECVCGARWIERGEGAVGRPQVTVSHEVCVKVEPRDRARRVDGERSGGCGARRIERDEGAVGTLQIGPTRQRRIP